MIKILTFLTIFGIFLSSCKTESNPEKKPSDTDKDTTIRVEAIDTITKNVDYTNIIAEEDLPAAVQNLIKDEEMKETKVDLEKKHGVQWDFCTCVLKSDSIIAAFETANDEDFDKLMERSDYIDSKCSMIRATPNTTPEERNKHEKAIKACRKSFIGK